MRCIYCRGPDVAVFTREHVLPRSLGTFEDNLVLHDTVCRDCNQYFGDQLELLLARGSVEAVERIRHGVKGPEAWDHLVETRVRFKWQTSGEWKGLLLRPLERDGHQSCSVGPQVGFQRKDGQGYEYFAEHDLADEGFKIPKDVERDKGIRILHDSPERKARLISLLEQRGASFKEKGPLELPEFTEVTTVTAAVQSVVDDWVFRCVAKFAFNYLAYVEGPAFVLHEDFDAIARYIREGETPRFRPVVFDNRPVLEDEVMTFRGRPRHYLTVEWCQDARQILGQVSLFNLIRYRVVLTPNYRGVWREFRSGHAFDFLERKVSKLTAVPRWLLP